MSLQDLKRLGVYVERPRDEVETRVPFVLLISTGLLAAGSCALMALGDGGTLTWVGVVLFGLGLFGFIAANLRGVKRSAAGK